MVINSLPTARARGEFLKRCHAYLVSSDRGGHKNAGKEGKGEDGEEKGDGEGAAGGGGAKGGGGHLFLMLPLSCLTHSRRLSLEGFRLLLAQHFGFRLVHERQTQKVAFFVLQAVRDGGSGKGVGGGEGGKKGGKIEKSSSWAKDFDVEAV